MQVDPSALEWKGLSVGGIVAYLLVKEVLGFLKGVKLGKNGNGNGTIAAEYQRDFWKMEMRQAIEEKVGTHFQKQDQILGEIRDGIREMVTIQRQRG